MDGAGHALFLVPTSTEYAQNGGHLGGFVMRAIWMFLATIATPLVVSPPLLAKEKDPALTSPTPALPAAPAAEKRPHETTLHGKPLSDPYHRSEERREGKGWVPYGRSRWVQYQ